MHILFYVPDNQITKNFVPQLWPFRLKSVTPPGHRVTIVDGNVVHWSEQEVTDFVRTAGVDLVGMGFMTRMAEKAYRVAAAVRETSKIPVILGGPHVTAVPGEPLGLTGQARCADVVVVGEADELWPGIVEEAAAGRLKEVYRLPLRDGQEVKPSLASYRSVPWDQVDLQLFDLMRHVPRSIRRLLRTMSVPHEKVYVIPVESGRGCPYGCEFCSVTGFFGNEIRFRTNESVIEELLLLKSLAKRDKALVIAFFIDDNLAINRKRTKSLLREMIRRDACLPWVGQVSMNLLRDEELVELIAASGGRWIFAGLESMEPDSLKAARKQFNKPDEYRNVLRTLSSHGIYAITSFIVGLEGDRTGMANRISREMERWPPVLPVFGLLTPYPDTPLYDRLKEEGRLTRPEHWLEFRAFQATFLPKHLTAEEAEKEIAKCWRGAYGPAAFRRTQKWLQDNGKPFQQQLMLFVARLLFRGIYFRQVTRWSWLLLLLRNSPAAFRLINSGLRYAWKTRRARRKTAGVDPTPFLIGPAEPAKATWKETP